MVGLSVRLFLSLPLYSMLEMTVFTYILIGRLIIKSDIRWLWSNV